MDAESDLKATTEQVMLIDRQTIAEVRMFNKPPIEVSQVMFTVMAILGEEEDWKSIKNVTKNGE